MMNMYVNINTPHVETHAKRSVSTQKPMLHVTHIWVNLYFLFHIKYSCTHHLLSASVLMCVFTVIKGLPQLVAALRESSYDVYFASTPFVPKLWGGHLAAQRGFIHWAHCARCALHAPCL